MYSRTVLVDGQDVIRELGIFGEAIDSKLLLRNMKSAVAFLSERQPASRIMVFVPKRVAERWRGADKAFMEKVIATPAEATPGRYLAQLAVRKNKEGTKVTVVSNSTYSGCVARGDVTDAWVQEHTMNYMFTPDGEFLCPEFEDLPQETVPEETVPENEVPEDAVLEDTVPEDMVPENTDPEDSTPLPPLQPPPPKKLPTASSKGKAHAPDLGRSSKAAPKLRQLKVEEPSEQEDTPQVFVGSIKPLPKASSLISPPPPPPPPPRPTS